MIGHILWEMFNWPSGNVLGNLMASALWAGPAFTFGLLKGRKQLRHLHTRLDKQDEQLDAHHDLIRQIHGATVAP